MNWIKIDPQKLPSGEVLAANFKEGTYGFKEKLVGYLDLEDTAVICSAEDVELADCTHYVDIHSFDNQILKQ